MGNLHCIGMCGPLVMLLGKHRYRLFYFLGRTLSFAFAGWFAGGMGAVLNALLSYYKLSALVSFLFGSLILLTAFFTLTSLRFSFPGAPWLAKKIAPLSQNLSLLLLRDRPLSVFLFGFFTIALPCGQTLLVFSACALAESGWIGFWNGFAFALLTSPSLFWAMQMHRFFPSLRNHYHSITGVLGLFIGGLAILRGFADMELLPHLVLNSVYHIVLY